jgi:hypothetical protein
MHRKLDPFLMFAQPRKGRSNVLREQTGKDEPAKKKHHRPDVIAMRAGNPCGD